MRGYYDTGGRHGVSSYYARTININNTTNITNITQVTHTHGSHSGGRKGHHSGKKNSGLGKPPKLWRYCLSCGLFDGDKVYRMSNTSICHEGAKVMGYSARMLGHSVSNIGASVCHMAGLVTRGVCSVVGAIFKA